MNKKQLMKPHLFFILFFSTLSVSAQTVDSLKLLLKNAKQDTVKLQILAELSGNCEQDEIANYTGQALELADKLLAEKSLIPFKKTILSSKAVVLNCMAIFLHNQGNITKALEYSSQSLKLYETLNDKNSMAILLNNIGSVYVDQNDLVKAAEYIEKSLNLQKQTNDEKTTAVLALNLGYIYSQQGKYKDALKNYKTCSDLLKKVDSKPVRAMLLNNTGLIYMKQNKVDSAMDFFFKSLKLREELNDKFGQASSLSGIAHSYFYKKKYKLSQLYADSSVTIAKHIGFPIVISYAERVLAIADSAIGDHKAAFEHYK